MSRLRLCFMGTPDFAVASLAALLEAGHDLAAVYTRAPRPARRGHHVQRSPVHELALARGLAVCHPAGLRDPAEQARFAALGVDAAIVVAYGLILPAPLLRAPRLGCLNIHASLLPRWRGAAPIQRALLAGDRETGISIMQMDAGLDTGPVLRQRAVLIAADEDAGSLHDKLAALGAEMIVEILAAPPRPDPQPKEGVTYARKIEKADTVLDWSRPAVELERAVRAFRPAPGTSTSLAGEAIKIWRTRLVSEKLPPGVIGQNLVVGCGEGALAVEELQRAGGKRMSAAQFLRGRPLVPGARFG